MMAAKIISPVIDSSYTAGYNWCIEQVKSSQYVDLAHSLDIDKAIGFLKQKDFHQVLSVCLFLFVCLSVCQSVCVCLWCLLCVCLKCQAVETLKSFEKKDSKVAAAAATNLSFLYNLVRALLLSHLTHVMMLSLLKQYPADCVVNAQVRRVMNQLISSL